MAVFQKMNDMRKCNEFLVSVLVFLFVFGVFTPTGSVSAAPISVEASNALLMEFAGGEMLWSKNIDESVAPASLTKIMTLFIVFDALASGSLRLDEQVTVSEAAWRTGGSRMFLQVGSRVPVSELIKGIAVVSGNDACVAIAEHLCGSVEEFVSQMNERAEEMGLTQTRFVDPHGISKDNRISARDIADLARFYIDAHPESLAYHSMEEYSYLPEGDTQPIKQHNRNNLLGSYDGIDGLKTGHTEAAGYNLVATAERKGTRFITVVLGVRASSEPAGERLRATETRKLLDYGFSNFETRNILTQNELLGHLRIYKGVTNTVAVGAAHKVQHTFSKNTDHDVQKEIVLDERVCAPINKGQYVGKLVLSVDGEHLVTVPVVSLEDVSRGGFFKRAFDSLKLLLGRVVKIG